MTPRLQMDNTALNGLSSRLGTIVSFELSKNTLDVIFCGIFDNPEFVSYLLVTQAPGEQPENFDFASAQVRTGHLGRQRRCNRCGKVLPAGVNSADGVNEFIVGSVFGQKGLRTRDERSSDVLITSKGT
jgi:hypothetical protein